MGKDIISCMAEPGRGPRTGSPLRHKRNLSSASHVESRSMAILSCAERIGNTWWQFNPNIWEEEDEETLCT